MTHGRLDKDRAAGRHLTEQQAATYVHSLLSETVKSIPEKHRLHVEDCFDCKTMIMEVYGVLTHEDEAPLAAKIGTPHFPMGERSWFSFAAAVAIVVVALFLPRQLTERGDSSFAPYLPLESLIDVPTRSLEGLDTFPPSGAEVSNPVTLEWSIAGSRKSTVVVTDNRGNEVISLIPEEGSVSIPEALEPGLYYWKLVAADDLLFVSKFLIPRPD